MPKNRTRIVALALASVALLAGAPWIAWICLTYQPHFYRTRVAVPRQRRQEEARHFVAQSLQLRNDIYNEPRWEAVFTDQEVNAWLAEDLVPQYADKIPPEVHEPCIAFEPDRVILAFQLDQGPVRSVISVVARVRVPEKNQIALTLEQIRAGVVPVPAEKILDRATRYLTRHGVAVRWERDGDLPMAVIAYRPDQSRHDVVLDQLLIGQGRIRLAGRSNRVRGAIVSPKLPRRKVLQSTFPRRNSQAGLAPGGSDSTLRSSATPTS